MRTAIDPPLDRPMMVFDGDCGFCRCWIERWRQATGDRIRYEAYQQVGSRFKSIPEAAFAEAVQLIEPDGNVASGADAVFRLLEYAGEKRRVFRGLGRLRVFMPLARAVYRLVARHRMLFSVLTRPWCRPVTD